MELDLNKNSGNVTYFHEIIEELSKEHGIDVKEMREICSLSLDYIKHLTKKKETLGIRLPFLGVLYFSNTIGKFFAARYRDDGDMAEELENLNYRIEEAKKPENKRLRKRPFIYKFKRILKKKGYNLPRGGVTLGYKEFWSIISEIQNDTLNE